MEKIRKQTIQNIKKLSEKGKKALLSYLIKVGQVKEKDGSKG